MFKLKGEPEKITEGVEEYTEVWERKLVKARRLLNREEICNTGPDGGRFNQCKNEGKEKIENSENILSLSKIQNNVFESKTDLEQPTGIVIKYCEPEASQLSAFCCKFRDKGDGGDVSGPYKHWREDI